MADNYETAEPATDVAVADWRNDSADSEDDALAAAE